MNLDTLHHDLPRLYKLVKNGYQGLIRNGLKGIEKESLRIAENGFIAHTPHPEPLGSALTNPHITTDYSEALLEFITPAYSDIRDSLRFLENIHQFVYDNIGRELLLSTSMPCGINGDESIPIATYGSSNIGHMKHVYRKGLAYRYGRTMQSIAGIHFNYSVPTELWPVLQALENNKQSQEQFVNDAYFGLIRNFQRQGWLILYLFGASPAICKTFFKTRPHFISEFDQFDQHTLFHPYATSLRMSDIGYKSTNQANLDINYNHLDGYVESLSEAIETPYEEYEKIGVKVKGDYRQLNSNALQIENEYYSTIRPKQVAKSCEKPTLALKRRGVQYVEIRSMDLNLFDRIGINESTARFTEALLLTCLLQESPGSGIDEQAINNDNQLAVAHQGRKPNLELQRGHNKVLLKDWAREIFTYMEPVCEILDRDLNDKPYSMALATQKKCVEDSSLTPSAKILEAMRIKQKPFAPYALEISRQHQQYFKTQQLPENLTDEFVERSRQSLLDQKQIEANDTLSFDEFLVRYFSQNCP